MTFRHDLTATNGTEAVSGYQLHADALLALERQHITHRPDNYEEDIIFVMSDDSQGVFDSE
jgi:hypothetical protein